MEKAHPAREEGLGVRMGVALQRVNRHLELRRALGVYGATLVETKCPTCGQLVARPLADVVAESAGKKE